MFCIENKQTRGGSRTLRSSMMELFVKLQIISYWQRSSNLDDVGIIELPLYAIIFSFHDIIKSMEEDKNPENSSVSHTGTFFLFSVRGIYFFSSSAEKRLFFDKPFLPTDFFFVYDFVTFPWCLYMIKLSDNALSFK